MSTLHIDLADFIQTLSILTFTGTQSQELTVHPPVFEQYFDVELFQLRLTLTDNSTGISGTSSLNLTRNNPPSDGNCTITPANGTALVTNFTIRCYDFVDKEGDEISNYLIRCKTFICIYLTEEVRIRSNFKSYRKVH